MGGPGSGPRKRPVTEGTSRAVLDALTYEADLDGLVIVAVEEMAATLSLHYTTVRRALADLEAAGLLSIDHGEHGAGKAHAMNAIQLLTEDYA